MKESPSVGGQPPVTPSSSPSPRHQLPPPIVLWRLRGAIEELRGVVIETSFGLALGLELDSELVLLHLQPNWNALATFADRLKSALISQGWQVVPATAERSH
jgi:hypothetical protein